MAICQATETRGDSAHAGSEGAGEFLQRRGLDGGLVQLAQAGFILQGSDGFAESLGHLAETECQRFQSELLEGLLAAFLKALLAEFLGDGHG